MIDLVEHETFLCRANSCKQQRFVVQTVQTFTVQTGAETHMPGTNEWTAGCNTSLKHT